MKAARFLSLRFALLAALLASACAPLVEVQTEPFDQSIPVTGLGVPAYVEVAIDLPPQSQGDVAVMQVTADVRVQNPSAASSMLVELRVSLDGTATPELPFVFTQANRPAYYDSSVLLLGPKTYAAGSSTPERISGAGLIPAIGRPRMYLIVTNTVNNLGLGDLLPLQINLNGIIVNAVVTKSLGGLNGGLETTGI